MTITVLSNVNVGSGSLVMVWIALISMNVKNIHTIAMSKVRDTRTVMWKSPQSLWLDPGLRVTLSKATVQTQREVSSAVVLLDMMVMASMIVKISTNVKQKPMIVLRCKTAKIPRLQKHILP